MNAGGNSWDITVAASKAASDYLREEIALYQARVTGWDSGDEAFRQAAEQCADEIDPDVWRYNHLT